MPISCGKELITVSTRSFSLGSRWIVRKGRSRRKIRRGELDPAM